MIYTDANMWWWMKMCKSVKIQLLLVIKDDKENRETSLLCKEGREPTRLTVINLIVVETLIISESLRLLKGNSSEANPFPRR